MFDFCVCKFTFWLQFMFRCISLLSVYFMCPCVFFSVQFLFPLISLIVCLLQQRHSTDREHSGCIFSPDATRAFIYFVYVYSSECRSRFRSISFSMFTSCAHMFAFFGAFSVSVTHCLLHLTGMGRWQDHVESNSEEWHGIYLRQTWWYLETWTHCG